MRTVSEVMTQDLVTLQELDTLEAADRYLELGHIRHLPVVRGRKLVGLVTHRDLLRTCTRKNAKTGAPLLAREVMTPEVTTVRPESSIREAIRLMLANKFGCLPVTDESGALRGILTESDLLRVADEYIASQDLRDEAAEWS